MQPDDIKQLIETTIPHCKALVAGDDGRHFEAIVISPLFSNKNRVQKQQVVYSALNSPLSDGTLHAISIKTYTPDEWEQHLTKSTHNG